MTIGLLSNISFYLPELLGVLTMCGLLFLESTYDSSEKKRTFLYVAAIIGFVLMLGTLFKNLGETDRSLFAGAVALDSFGTYMKMIMVVGMLSLVYLCHSSREIYENMKAEFLIMATGVLIGGMLLVSATNLLTVYLGVETLSILSYVLTSFKKKEVTSQEAGLKYVLYGGVSAGIMLYGMTHIYGITGSIQFDEIARAMGTLPEAQYPLALISFLMFFVGIGYKIACFPFHMWSPDVYQGSPTPVTAFFSIVPKVAGLAVVTRVTMTFFDVSASTQFKEHWIYLLQIISAMTMTVGNLSAINQESVKRMLAFSSIGHVGLILMGVLVMDQIGVSAILYYSLAYVFMTMVAFYVTSIIHNQYDSDNMVFFQGLIQKRPFLAIVMSVALFSLAGLPPLSGFIAKYSMLSSAVSSGFYGIAIIAAINSTISLYYYLRLIKMMVINQSVETDPIENVSIPLQIQIAVFTIPIIFLGIFWEGISTAYSTATLFIK